MHNINWNKTKLDYLVAVRRVQRFDKSWMPAAIDSQTSREMFSEKSSRLFSDRFDENSHCKISLLCELSGFTK